MAATGSPRAAPVLDGTDIETTADDERTDSLIAGLEAPTDDDDSSSADDGEVGANTSAWPALQYATYMTGTLQFVKEKHRVQGYLAAELARARKEFGEDGDDGPLKRPTLEVGQHRLEALFTNTRGFPIFNGRIQLYLLLWRARVIRMCTAGENLGLRSL